MLAPNMFLVRTKQGSPEDGALTRAAGHLLLGGMGLVGEALVLLPVLRGVLAVLCVLGRVLCVRLLGLAVGRVL